MVYGGWIGSERSESHQQEHQVTLLESGSSDSVMVFASATFKANSPCQDQQRISKGLKTGLLGRRSTKVVSRSANRGATCDEIEW